MGVVGWARSWLPYPFVGAIPVGCNVLSEAYQNFLCSAVKMSMPLCILGRSFYHFAVNIKLKLMSRPVTNSHRPRTEVAREIQFVFPWRHLTKHVV